MQVDREAVVRRHRVAVTALDPAAFLSVGNGELCATVDATGLQTFPEEYRVADPAGGAAGTSLSTQSQWGWHSTPRPEGADLDACRRPYRTSRGEVRYVDAARQDGSDDSALDEAHRWLRANPHRLDLVRTGLVTRAAGGRGEGPDGGGAREGSGPVRTPSPSELHVVDQVLDPWTGVVESTFELAGRALAVTTACHPRLDVLAFRVEARDGRPLAAPADAPADAATDAAPHDVVVRLAFPYGSQAWGNAADWTSPERHTTRLGTVPDGVVVHRAFDGADAPTYVVGVRTDGVVERTGDHELAVGATGTRLDLVLAFAPGPDGAPDGHPTAADPLAPPSVDDVLGASRAHWPEFWRRGAALDLAGSTDPRAPELERRAVLSQYLTAIQCAGSLPPQETGLTCNSWRGRFHLEMHWWHAAHFALWGRPELLERSMGWYHRVLPLAQETARVQGYDGARWPKQVGPDGRESPSDIGPFLLWQQPHVIHLVELLRRAGLDVAHHAVLVEQTARFMADVVEPRAGGRYGLGPPLIPAQESYVEMRDRVVDPPFELAAWAWALEVAQQWRERAGLPREVRWDEVRAGLVPPPVRDGRYAAVGVEPWTVRLDHPSMVYGLGVIPATGLLDPEVVRATLHDVLADWDWPSTWGWDYPALAMAAARLGEPATAVDALLLPVAKNTHLPNGHNHQTDELPVYLPGNGGLLAALALMVGGWDGAPATGDAPPGLPDDGTWVVRHEGFVRAP